MPTETDQVEAVRTSLRIVDALDERGASGLTELADSLDMPKSTVYVHLSTLVDRGFVIKDDDRYRLSLRFLELGASVRAGTLYEQAKGEVDAVAEDLGQLVNLMTEEDGLGVYVYSVRGPDAVDLDTTPGRHFPLNTTALGKAMLAQMTDERIDEIVDQHGLPARTDRTVTDREELLAQLETIRDRGYALDNEENLRGIACVAVPILVERGVIGALSASAPANRMDDPDFFDRVCTRLRDATNVIEVNIEYS